ncbi:hypothetical protein HDF09_002077 [Edaphobacter lichenicola]|uniref:Uncharacterized protein n=1 Tax=Tunturiibacter empetritectus TaxID=3069691 RepID=A0A7W8IJL8_9BACT|nr:hypothetical protein [Edaphobacter lichenicola]
MERVGPDLSSYRSPEPETASILRSLASQSRELWQADIATPQKYCRRFDVSHAVIRLDEYFAKIDPGRMAHN